MALTKTPIELSSTPGIVDNSNATAITIDSSENVMVNRTSVFTTAKMEIQSDAGDASTLALNSIDTDGSMLEFYKAGTAVGSIGSTAGTHLHAGSGDVGLLFQGTANAIEPWNPATNGARDNAIDLGLSGNRFKDIYLSGGVNFSANPNAGGMTSETLDDYETGSFTPSYTASSGNPTINYNTQTALYTKTGNVVTFTIMVVTNSRSGGSGHLSVAGLPFPVAAGQDYAAVIGFNYNWVSGENPQNAIAQASTSHVLLYKDAKTNVPTNPDDILSSGNSYLRLTGSYFTAS